MMNELIIVAVVTKIEFATLYKTLQYRQLQQIKKVYLKRKNCLVINNIFNRSFDES